MPDMAEDEPVNVATEPRSTAWIDDAVVAGGGRVVEPAEATAVVWTKDDDPDGLGVLLDAHPQIDWVQLPWAGIDPYREVIRAHPQRRWTCAKGVYSDPVAEHALALLLAGFRQLHHFARADTWTKGVGRNLFGARVTILGGGGIAQAFIGLLAPFGCPVTVMRHTPRPMDGVDEVLGTDDLHAALADADVLLLALPLLDSTRGIVGAEELGLLAPGAWVINVARGEHVDTGALIDSLDAGHLGGAALDVTDPEPLPAGHPLWSRSDVLITPHTANTPAMAVPLLGERITANVGRYRAGQPLDGLIDTELGY